uniref:DUF4218 domain-containing protein n=1 Tax=Arundo donax TaxID=35708 RepID=A0A0A8ZJN1_ARUDO
MFCRFLMTLKSYVHSRSHPEGAIAKNWVFNESLTFCSQCLNGCETRYTRKARNDDSNPNKYFGAMPYFHKNVGRYLVGKSIATLDHQSWIQAHRCLI